MTSDTAASRPVAVVGGGIAGLALAGRLRELGVGRVVVLERENQAGGIPRHCGHYPFGVREFGRLLKGPDYARENLKRAVQLGVEVQTGTTVTALHPDGRLSLLRPAGPQQLLARRVVLCTGARESSRAQRLIGGDRPLGVMSTAALQSLVYLQQRRPFENPVILGSELASFSAIETCRHLGMHPLAMLEEEKRIVTHRLLRPYLMLRGVALIVDAASPVIIGRRQVEAIEYTDHKGQQQRIPTDGVIVSGRFRPESALLRQSHLALDAGTGGPQINQFGQCSDPAYYSSGNLLRAAESAGYCWREGVATAGFIAQDLLQGQSRGKAIALKIRDPAIEYILPQRLCMGERAGGMEKMQLGLRQPVNGWLQASVAGQCIWRSRIHSRPVRRIRFPLQPFYRQQPQGDIEFSIERS